MMRTRVPADVLAQETQTSGGPATTRRPGLLSLFPPCLGWTCPHLCTAYHALTTTPLEHPILTQGECTGCIIANLNTVN